jgi:hypothetical protein
MLLDASVDQWQLQSNMVVLHNDLKKRSFGIKFAFIKKGWDLHLTIY